MIASFTTAISLTVCLPACPTYLCLNLSNQFLSHSPRLLVITHHPLIERKGACFVNNLTNLYDLIYLEHVSANIPSHKWFMGLVAEFTPLFTRLMHFYHDMAFYIKNAITRVQNSWDENNKNVTALSRAKPSEWWQAPWLSDKRASGLNTLLTLLIRRIWCSQLTKLAKHQMSLWYGMWLLWIALIPGYIFSIHCRWAGGSQSFLLLLSTLNIFFIFVFPKRKKTLHCCTPVSHVTAL